MIFSLCLHKTIRSAVSVVLSLFVFSLSISSADSAGTTITVRDEANQLITMQKPASRVISLAPHLTELMYEVGAGDQLVAVGEYSDYPDAARRLPRVGNASAIDLEKIVSLKPDLVLVWKSGTPVSHQQRLKRLGIRVVVMEMQRLEDVATSIRNLGLLTGKEKQSTDVAQRYLRRLGKLRAKYSGRASVSLFYQLWNQPLMTISRNHMLNNIISMCGGSNIYAELEQLVPTVGLESVIKRAPEVIVASGAGSERPKWLDDWKRWPTIPAVKKNNIFYIPSDLIVRQSSRVLEGAELLCRKLEQARQKRLVN